jgi:excisionase family DNA binding protein
MRQVIQKAALDGMTRRLISVNDAANLLGISRSLAYEWLRRNELPGAVIVGTRAWVRRAVLERWVNGDSGDDGGSDAN